MPQRPGRPCQTLSSPVRSVVGACGWTRCLGDEWTFESKGPVVRWLLVALPRNRACQCSRYARGVLWDWAWAFGVSPPARFQVGPTCIGLGSLSSLHLFIVAYIIRTGAMPGAHARGPFALPSAEVPGAVARWYGFSYAAAFSACRWVRRGQKRHERHHRRGCSFVRRRAFCA